MWTIYTLHRDIEKSHSIWCALWSLQYCQLSITSWQTTGDVFSDFWTGEKSQSLSEAGKCHQPRPSKVRGRHFSVLHDIIQLFRVWRVFMSKLLVRQQMNSLLPCCYVQCIFSCSDQSVVQNVIGFLQDYVPQVSSWREAGEVAHQILSSPFLGTL